MLFLKLVLLLTEIFQNTDMLEKHIVSYTSTIPEVTWYKLLYNNLYKIGFVSPSACAEGAGKYILHTL